ncbi:MAG TPA: hypothetical protein VGM30_24515 [Puia sp.]|jgi:hypothetical protein
MVNRRHFLKVTGLTTLAIPFTGIEDLASSGVSMIPDPADPFTALAPVRWAAGELEAALTAKGMTVRKFQRLGDAPAGDTCIVYGGMQTGMAAALLRKAVAGPDGSPHKAAAGPAHLRIPQAPESLALFSLQSEGQTILLACGHDTRGLVYALLELADRVRQGSELVGSLTRSLPMVEQPANEIRSLTRLFVSEVEDKPWFNDRAMWPAYLTMLATQRFNRFNLALGIGYDFINHVTDGYFLFAYPFLLSVPGYAVRVPQLPEAERDHNLQQLQYIGKQTVARGLQFQLGIWMHGYEWIDSPNPNYTIEGLTKENHGVYCRDAIRLLLQSCPEISGITFRVHGESGVQEGSYAFWATVFEGVKTCGRTVGIDIHAKGTDEALIKVATDTGLPITLSPKYWAEHMGMPYMQTDIRELEKVHDTGRKASGLMNLSDGARSFMRYGYGDLLKKDRPYKVIYRIWPGTQRLLLWGDPVTMAAHARNFNFCGCSGVELMEPLSFKGRRGSGLAGDRCGYADASLRTKWDWEKYLYTLRVFGRLSYDPEAAPDSWRRYLVKEFGAAAADPAEQALANATRILPIVLTVHAASAGNNNYWPEIYSNQAIVPQTGMVNREYGDTPTPKLFGYVSPLDPQLFLNSHDFAVEWSRSEHSGKYTPVEAAQWLEEYAAAALRYLSEMETAVKHKDQPAYRRLAIDVSIQAGLGRFYAAKFRSGALYAIFEQNGDRIALEEALVNYRTARVFWKELADKAGVYRSDLTFGETPWLRGHWSDRLAAIDEDIDHMARKIEEDALPAAMKSILQRPVRATIPCHHKPPGSFVAGQTVPLALGLESMPSSVRLYYRHVNQAEHYQMMEMQLPSAASGAGLFQATIPETYTGTPYALQYYFEIRQEHGVALLYPGFNAALTNQPYFVIRQGTGQ